MEIAIPPPVLIHGQKLAAHACVRDERTDFEYNRHTLESVFAPGFCPDTTDRKLLAAIEDGLAIVPEPYGEDADSIGLGEADVITRLKRLEQSGVVTRFGCIVRHRKLGYTANAMAVWQAKREKIHNFSVLVSHVLVPPAIRALMTSPDCRVNGFIAPGHVCTVMGYEEYEGLVRDFRVPIVVGGFEPVDLLEAVRMLVRQLENGEAKVENQYVRSVHYQGNLAAQRVVQEVFEIADQKWRGIGTIPASGLRVRDAYGDSPFSVLVFLRTTAIGRAGGRSGREGGRGEDEGAPLDDDDAPLRDGVFPGRRSGAGHAAGGLRRGVAGRISQGRRVGRKANGRYRFRERTVRALYGASRRPARLDRPHRRRDRHSRRSLPAN